MQEVTVGEDVEMSLTTAVSTESNEIHGIGIKVVKNSLAELKEPDKSNAVPAVRILASLIRCSSGLPLIDLALYALNLCLLMLTRSIGALLHISRIATTPGSVQKPR